VSTNFRTSVWHFIIIQSKQSHRRWQVGIVEQVKRMVNEIVNKLHYEFMGTYLI